MISPSDFKFYVLLWSRIVEEGIPKDYANKIVAMIEFDMSGIQEDDDYLGDVALKYAEYCSKVYFKLHLSGMRDLIDPQSVFMRRVFNPLGTIKLNQENN